MSSASPITSHALLSAPPSQGRPSATRWIGLRLGSHESNSQLVTHSPVHSRCACLSGAASSVCCAGLTAEASASLPGACVLSPPAPSRTPAIHGGQVSGEVIEARRHAAPFFFSRPKLQGGPWTWGVDQDPGPGPRTRTRPRLRTTCQIPNPIFALSAAACFVNLLSQGLSQSASLPVWPRLPSNSTCVMLYATGLPTS